MLTEQQRRKLLETISGVVTKNFSDTHLKWVDWSDSLAKHQQGIISAEADEAFELKVRELLKELKVSHVGFYHETLKQATSKMALCATYLPRVLRDGERWVFQDVHDGGPAAIAGIRPGDVLISVEDKSIRPPEHPAFPIGATVTVNVLARGQQEKSLPVVIPRIKTKTNQLPQVLPSPLVSHRRINHEIGYIKIAAYPGVVGIEVANDMSSAVDSLKPCNRLIVDLRGNTGGGAAFLRLLSLLTPERLPVGRISRSGLIRNGKADAQDFVFDQIPRDKVGLYLLVLRFGREWLIRKAKGRDMPVVVVTEGQGKQPFHGRVVLLVNQHTASANEMVISAARESNLAVIVGEPTPGRLLKGSKSKVGFGYWLALPAGSYESSGNDPVEGRPIPPDVLVEFDHEQFQTGLDPQLEKAIDVVSRL